jgi:hypothetical protein
MAEFVTKKENTRRMATIIVCVILDALALAIGIYAVKGGHDVEKKQDNPNSIEKLRGRIAEARKANAALVENLNGFGVSLGWRFHAVGTMDRFQSGELQAESLKKYLSDWAVELKKFKVDKYKRWDAQGPGENLHLLQLMDELLAKEKEYAGRITGLLDDIKKEREREVTAAKAIETESADLTKKLDGAVPPNQEAQGQIGELIKLMKEFNALQKSHGEELDTLEIDTRKKQDEATTLKNEIVRKKKALEDVLAELRTRIYTIQHKQDEARERREPDGEIISVDEPRQLVYINLLRKDRLFNGTKFYVFSLAKGGVKVDKGQIEVIDVRESTASVARIIRLDSPDWPIENRDKIYNELYEGGKTRYIAFAGRFTGKLSNEEAAAFIRKFGDHYQEKVDARTNYVIVSEGYKEHPNYLVAKDLGVKILLEKYLYDYLGVK